MGDLDGYDEEWVELEKKMGRPQLPDSIDARREAFNTAMVEMAKQLPPVHGVVANVRDVEATSDRPKLRLYTPLSRGELADAFSCVVYCHGGGWLSGNLDTEDHMCRTLCARVGCVVVSVEYGIFPFVQFPRMVEDVHAAVQWTWTNAQEISIDPSRIAICGGSAGAALAIATVYRLVAARQGDRVSGLISLQGLFVDPQKLPEKLRKLHTSYEDNSGPLPIVSGDDMKFAMQKVVGEDALNDVSLFPLHAAPESLRGFPRTYIINTDKEALRDDGTVLEAALSELGVAVKRDCMHGLPHYFWTFPAEKAGERFRDLFVKGVQWVLCS